LGVDNILAAEIVTHNGSLITVNKTGPYSDLYWAIRGGGGSNWGIFTSITYRAHSIPKGGFTSFVALWAGTFCTDSKATLNSLIDNYLSWSQTLDTSIGGLAMFVPNLSA
jgi:ribonuclease T2